MKVLILSALIAVATAANVRDRTFYEGKYEEWRGEHGSGFLTARDYVHRLNAFADNEDMITKHNLGNHSWTMGHNAYSDMTWDEFKNMFMSEPMPKRDANPVNDFDGVEAAPASVDWSAKGAVTPIKNQGQCGSCWAFSTTGGLEGAYFIKNKKLVSFSEQQLVDCDKTDSGCQGGLMDSAFKWIEKNGGLCKEGDYGYKAKNQQCKKTCSVVPGSAPSKFQDVAKNQKALMAAVSQQPISVAIEADQNGFQFYNSGVFTGACGTNLDHGVLAVGYGSQGGKDFWKVKNSWGKSWGMNGYILMQRGKSQKGGQCGILTSASYPTL